MTLCKSFVSSHNLYLVAPYNSEFINLLNLYPTTASNPLCKSLFIKFYLMTLYKAILHFTTPYRRSYKSLQHISQPFINDVYTAS